LARSAGDNNFTTREKRLTAQKGVLEARNVTLKEQLKVKDVRIKELREKLKAKNAPAKKTPVKKSSSKSKA
jgi:hypothetical protein